MKKLIYYEFRKLSYQKIFLIFFGVLLILNGVFLNREISDPKIQDEKDMSAFIKEYQKDPEEMERYMAEYTEVYRAIASSWSGGEKPALPASIYSTSDMQLFSSFAQIRDLNEDYKSILDKAKKTSMGMLKEYAYLGYAEDSFHVVYQNSVLKSYEPLENLQFPLENIVGFDLFFDYNGFCVFLLLGIALLGIQLITEEQSAGMLMILRSSKKGRQHTMAAKFVVGFIMTVLLCTLFMGVSLLVLLVKIGLHGWNLPIQMIESMQLCPLQITVGEGILLSLLIQIFTSIAFLTVTMLLAVLLKNMLAIFASVVGFIGVNFAVANIQFFDGYSFFKNINLFWCLDGTRLLSKYCGVRIFEKCFHALLTWLVLYAVIACLSIVFATFFFANGKVTRGFRLKKAFRLPFTRKKKARYPRGIYRFELKKVCTVITAVIVFASMSLLSYLSDGAYNLKRNFDDNFYSEYMAEIEGEWTAEKHAKIETEYRENNAVLSKKNMMEESYQNGEISKEEYNRYLYEALEAETKQSVLKKLYERSRYLKEQQEAGFSVAYFDDTGWNLLRQNNFSWVICLAVIVICADIFSLEYRSGFIKIGSVTKKGRKRVLISKFFVVITIASLLGLLSNGLEMIFADYFSGLHGAKYSARSMELESSLSVFGYFALMTIKQLALFSLLAVLTAGLSRLTKKLIPTLLIITVLIFFPMIFSYFGISLFEKFSFLNLFVR